eukprot:SAG22_NODE_3906_length_1473_cov_1.217455_2_plen_279_part_00
MVLPGLPGGRGEPQDPPVRQRSSLFTAFPCVSLPFLVVPLCLRRTVAIRSKRGERPAVDTSQLVDQDKLRRVEALCKKLPEGHFVAVLGSQLEHVQALLAACQAEQVVIKPTDMARMRDAAALQRFLKQKLATETSAALVESIFTSFVEAEQAAAAAAAAAAAKKKRPRVAAKAAKGEPRLLLGRDGYKSFVMKVAGSWRSNRHAARNWLPLRCWPHTLQQACVFPVLTVRSACLWLLFSAQATTAWTSRAGRRSARCLRLRTRRRGLRWPSSASSTP